MQVSCRFVAKNLFRCWPCALVRRLTTVATFFVISLLTPSDTRAQFFDGFSSPVLDPAWTVVQTWPGGSARSYGYTSPGNHFSLTDNPGHLRYWLDPMTHFDGFLNSYATTYAIHSCCTHDAGLDLLRQFTGDHWQLEARADYYLPYTNGRYFELRLYFGDGTNPTYVVRAARLRDLYSVAYMDLRKYSGESLWDYYTYAVPLEEDRSIPVSSGDHDTLYWRFERVGGILTARSSPDGLTWTTAWSHDFGSALDGLDQRVAITGICWFNTGGSYADWDYISVTPSVVPVEIDIEPGSDPASINPRAKGVIPVAILTTSTGDGDPLDFDASEVDPLSLAFGPAGAGIAHSSGHVEDVDGDGDLDLVLHFRTQESGVTCGDTSVTLIGQTFGGQQIQGVDSIVTVGCR
jgi:hypothetical protein